MYIAMNRFKIVKGREEDFENVWRSRRSRLDEMNGFVEFRLLRGPAKEDHTLFATYTLWTDYKDFVDWTQSEQFRDAHKSAGDTRGMLMGHPEFEGFHTILTQGAPALAGQSN